MNYKIGAAYLRVSTEDQVEYSPGSQIKLIRDHAKRDGYFIPDEYVFRDDGISGKSADKRPAFRLMIATAKEDDCPFDAIFVWKFSRFARNQEEAIMYKNLLRKKGVDVRSISEPSNDSPFASLIERIIEWMDEYYLINLSGEVKRGMKEKSRRGEALGRPPFGYDVKDKVFVPNENAEIVRTIFEWYASGLSLHEIARRLNNIGVKTQKWNADIRDRTVKYYLTNPVYIGKIRWDDSLTDGKHQPIISQELWDKVQTRVAKNAPSVKYVRAGKHAFMLQGLIRCDNCGSTIVRSSRGTDRKLALQCCGYKSGKCMESHFILESKANDATIAALEQIIEHRAFTFALQEPPKSGPVRDWGKLIAAEETRLKRAKEAFLDGIFSKEEYAAAKKSAEDTIAKLEAQRGRNDPQPVDMDVYQKRTIEVLKIIKSQSVSEEAKNLALRSIIDRIVFSRKENTFDFYFLP